MSLFKARDWWATTAGDEEEYDLGCLCVANIDNSPSGYDKIVTGSYHGTLRIYVPRPVKAEHGWSGFKPEDLLLETQLQQPILQVAAGRFMSGTENLHLAVLHPRKIAVFNVSAVMGAVEHGSHCQLKLMYEHALQRTTYNFCYGPFGGVKGKDFICVQSMDGAVSVFEQESFAFCRFLPGALLPGPIQYVAKTDSFVTISSSRQLESYKYQVLAVATDAKTKEESQNIKSGKKVAVDWSYNIGEQALDLVVVSFPQSPISIFVLGERNVYSLTEGGKLRFMKKLEYNPSCFLPFTTTVEGTVNYLVGTHTHTVMVYQDVKLVWAAQVSHIPVQIRVANFQDLKGVIVSLSEDGHLSCCYLGTDPSMITTPTSDVREIDYAEQDTEMRQLTKLIRQQSNKPIHLPTASSDDDIQMAVQIPHNLDETSQAIDIELTDEDPIPSLTLKVVLKAKVAVSNVRVCVSVNSPLIASQNLFTFASLDSLRPGEASTSIYLCRQCLPAQMYADITTTYQNISGAPRILQSRNKLPLKLVVKPCLPVKTATYKLTLDTNKPPVNLNDIFPELLGDSAGGPGNALGFQIFGGSVITILASKTSQRYRLQCDVFGAMWLLANELVSRLTSYFNSRKQTDFKASFDGQLPLQEYYDAIDAHFDSRLDNERYKEVLAQRANQFRAIQRRLLTRFKDKTPAPLANLNTLLDGTYRQILALADAIEQNRFIQESTACNLSCVTSLFNLLLRLSTGMSDEEFTVLQSALNPSISDNDEQGWEERTDASITHLLRTCLSKTSKDQTVNMAPLAVPKDTSKLRKHIALLCDRLTKGARLIVEGAFPGPAKNESRAERPSPVSKKPTANGDHSRPSENNFDEQENVPVGSRFGEKKSPRLKGKELPPLGGTSRLPPLGGSKGLPPLGSNKLSDGLSGLTKRKAVEDVPDLDDMESESAMINGENGERVYSL